jgi:dethiobiotin synthetase
MTIIGGPVERMLRIGVTGTDTAVGKTVVSCALVGLLRGRGMRTSVMKPVETGVVRGEARSDHMLLAAAAAKPAHETDICPVILDEALAPWVAAKAANRDIDIKVLDESFARACDDADAIVVEGAGGLLVPITRSFRFDHLFARWNLDIVIVAADRLGVINHSLLTIAAAQQAGLRVRGIVINQLHRAIPNAKGMSNADALRELMPDIPIVEFPCVEGLHGIRPLRTSSVQLDADLLRDVALSTGLASLVFEPSLRTSGTEG